MEARKEERAGEEHQKVHLKPKLNTHHFSTEKANVGEGGTHTPYPTVVSYVEEGFETVLHPGAHAAL